MLTEAENQRLTQVGRGTPMGELLRRYWQPVAASAQIRERKVMPVRLYGEDLVLFFDEAGNLGLVGDRCPHRLVKLECGYTTGAGLRCPYHGWTFDTAGRCVDQPAEPPGSTFKDKVTIASYPVQELAGLVFAYLGPAPAPLLPRWDRLVWKNVFRVVAMYTIPCNWLQCMENTPDPVHTEYLHGAYYADWLEKNNVPKTDRRWNLARGFQTHFLKHDYAFGTYGLDRRWLLEGQSKEKDTWGAPQPMVFPDIHCTSGSGRHTFGWRVPIDDHTTMEIMARAFDPGPDVVVPEQTTIPYFEVPVIDRDGRYTALHSVGGQDVMAWVSQGTVMDRSRERLGDTDRGVIMFRQLIQQQLARVEAGEDPINVFRDPAANVQIDLPVPWDRGYAWGFAKDGSYTRGALTAGDPMPAHIAEQVEDLFVEAAAKRKPAPAAVG